MATVTATGVQVHGFTTPNGFQKASDGKQVIGCFVSMSGFAGTYAAADDATILDLVSIIRDARRCGKTPTLIAGCMAAPGREAGAVVGVGAVAVDGVNLDFPLTQADLTTEHANAAMGVFEEGPCLFVTFKE
jgi:hypothetical protein